jgi:hypothetical protein
LIVVHRSQDVCVVVKQFHFERTLLRDMHLAFGGSKKQVDLVRVLDAAAVRMKINASAENEIERHLSRTKIDVKGYNIYHDE